MTDRTRIAKEMLRCAGVTTYNDTLAAFPAADVERVRREMEGRGLLLWEGKLSELGHLEYARLRDGGEFN